MYGNATALSEMARMRGEDATAEKYASRAEQIKQLVQNLLWNKDSVFFETLRRPGEFAQVREAVGYIPWYFNLPDKNSQFGNAWKQVTDEQGFLAPFGLTTAERRHPEFRTHGCCKCEWDGAVWHFASAQMLTALANYLNNYPEPVITNATYFRLLELYVESQYYRGRPYIGEYLDETTGYWLKGDQERSRYYNHSTFNDLVISGLIGLRPRPDNTLEINPLIPESKWNWFCLDNVSYHGRNITVVWDKTGGKYGIGKGFRVLVDGKEAAWKNKIEKIEINL
jgi:hypothetical protein